MPVLVTTFKASKFVISLGATPAFANSNIHRGLVPNTVTLYSPSKRANVLRSGWKGLPSYMTMRAPRRRAPTSNKYIIHPVVVNCSTVLEASMVW
jgi:hypothetical protein